MSDDTFLILSVLAGCTLLIGLLLISAAGNAPTKRLRTFCKISGGAFCICFIVIVLGAA